MTRNITEAIIRDETNSIRFEDFCREVCERHDGIRMIPTSKSYDQGRDAKSLDPRHGAFVCATLQKKDLEGKIDADTRHLQSTSSPSRVTYCTSVPLSEDAIDDFERLIRKNTPQATVRVLSAPQVADLAAEFPEIITKYYLAELRQIETMFLRLEDGLRRTDDDALRLALLALGTDDSRQLREDIAQTAILQALRRSQTPLSVEQIAGAISAGLRIPSSVHPTLIEAQLATLAARGFIIAGGGWTLTEDGRNAADNVPTQAAQEVLHGARVVQTALEELSGYKFTDLQFAGLWTTLLDYLAELFHSKGLAVIHAINDVLSGTVKSTVPLEHFATAGAAKIRAAAAIPEMGEVIEQAVVDMLTERTGPAFEWLARVCERFVALCALGLETTSTEEIRKIIARHSLVLDSDILITLMCAAERGHGAVRDVIARWQRLGGRILLAPQVLEEVAYHAYISDRDFQETKQLGPSLKGADLRRYCSNAFVRAFYAVENDVNQWPAFRDQYAGSKPHDYSKIVEVLRDEMLFEALPSDFDKEFADDVTRYLRDISSDSEQVEMKYFGDPGRLGRDGQLLAIIAHTRSSERQALNDARIMLLSSSARLRKADERFRSQIGHPESVISRAAVSYLIALVPDAGLGAASLRKALFEFGEAAHFTDTERVALRLIKASNTVIMPWAKRPALRRQLETTLRKEADRSNTPLKQVRLDFVAGKDPDQTAHIIASTISELALQDPERIRLQRELAETKKELAAVARKSRTVQRSTRRGRRRSK